MMYPVNVTVTGDQVLEGEIGRDSIARKTVQPGNAIQPSGSFLY